MAVITRYFLGANSGQGFQNLFSRFCEPNNFHDLLVLKGGPGSGKSTMMKKIGAAMEAKGEQVEYLHCSGDPDSLDGVHIPRIRTAVIDGTSPHIVEPKYPAAVDRYVNLGQFYDIAAAKAVRNEIVRSADACSAAYGSAYRALAAARNLEDNVYALLSEGFDFSKMNRRAEGIIAREIKGKGRGRADSYRFLGSITHKGDIQRFDTVAALCPRVYHFLDSVGVASHMLSRILAAAQDREYSVVICPDPEHMERILHLLIPELGVAFVTVKEEENAMTPYRRIHLDEMVSPDHKKRWRGRVRFLQKMAQTLREEGVVSLREAKTAHDELEGAYRLHVDFSGIDDLTEQEIRRIERYL